METELDYLLLFHSTPPMLKGQNRQAFPPPFAGRYDESESLFRFKKIDG